MGYLQCLIISILRVVNHIYFLFPVKKKILFCSYDGKGISCSPLYFNRYLIENNLTDAKFIWAVNSPENVKIPVEISANIEIVKTGTLKYLYECHTSSIVIFNSGLKSGSLIAKRKSQVFVNTWHGGGAFKKVGLDTDLTQKQRYAQKIGSKQIDYFLSTNKKFSEVNTYALGISKDKFLEIGMPRNDILFTLNCEIKTKIQNYFNISKEKKILLYAPTYRGEEGKAEGNIYLNEKKVLQSLRKRFNGDWVILMRMHYYINQEINNDNIIDVSKYDDMQELLLTADILITDYSSCMWDFSLMQKPGFLLTADLSKYKSERDFYTPIELWPYEYFTNNEDMCSEIENYDHEKACARIKKYQELVQITEQGDACEKLYKVLCDKL